MKASIAKKWVKALRSGKYKQGTGDLRFKNYAGEYQYCCLGVLHYVVLGGKAPRGQQDNGGLPRVSCVKAGIASSADDADHGTSRGMRGRKRPLTALNDNGMSFERIADIIEREYKDL